MPPLHPALRVMLLGLLPSYLSQHSKTHTHNVLMVVGAEGRLGKHCSKCISAGRMYLIILFCGPFERTLLFFKTTSTCSFPAPGKVLVFHQRSQMILLLLLLIPRKLPICLSHGIRAWYSMSRLRDAVSHQGKLGGKPTDTGNFLLCRVCCGQRHHPQTPC